MTIRPVDLQTLIPKLPELQKAKSAENELEKNNLNINMHKEQELHEKDTRQVTMTKKTEGSKVEREKQQKDRQGRQQKSRKESDAKEKDAQDRQKKAETRKSIDIRI